MLLPDVQDDLPSVPRELALRALCDSARLFCFYSTAWRERLTVPPPAAGAPEAPVPVPLGAEVVALHQAWVGGRELPVVDADTANRLVVQQVDAQEPGAVSLRTPELIEFIPAFKAAPTDPVTFWVSLRPTRASRDIPDHIGSRYALGLAAGAKEMLARMPGRPWTSGDNASMWAGFAATDRANARRDIESAYNSAELRVQLRKWV